MEVFICKWRRAENFTSTQGLMGIRRMVELLTVTAKQEGKSWEEGKGAGFDMLFFVWQEVI